MLVFAGDKRVTSEESRAATLRTGSHLFEKLCKSQHLVVSRMAIDFALVHRVDEVHVICGIQLQLVREWR